MLQRGHIIADYKIVEPLDENQIFQTFLVEGTESKLYWLHLINPDLFLDTKSRQNFLTDAGHLIGQKYPEICCLLQAEADDEYTFALYPIPAGQPLRDCLDADWSVRQSLQIVRQVVESLQQAHQAGFWHGNLSPETIYLSNEGVSLANFAFSSLVPIDFNSGVNPSYSSPELVRGETLGPAADIYSLGIVLYRLLTGEQPFVGEEPFAIAMQHLQGDISQLPEYLKICQPVLDLMLQAFVDERLAAAELLENLDRLLAMPDLDELQQPIQLTMEEAFQPSTPEMIGQSDVEEMDDLVSEVTGSIAENEASSGGENVVAESDVAARIEERLKERAAALQLSAQNSEHERVDTKRMAEINRSDRQVSKNMDANSYQKKSGRGRFLLLALLGIAIGSVLYLFIFSQQPEAPATVTVAPSEELLAALEEGRQQLQAEDFAAAEKTFVALVERYPNSPQPYNNLAVVYASQGQLSDARIALEEALATDEGYATVYRNLGTVYAEMARDSYGRALQLKAGGKAVDLQLFAAAGPLSLSLQKEDKQPEETMVTDPIKPVVSPTGKPVVTASTLEAPAAVESTVEKPADITTIPAAIQQEIVEVVLEPEPESAELFLRRWSEAWSAQNVESYLSFYADNFVPSSGQSRSAWEKNRQQRLTKPKRIEVTLDDFSMVRMRGDKLQMELTQGYKSDTYSDRTRKLFDLQRKGNGWEILRERSLGRVR